MAAIATSAETKGKQARVRGKLPDKKTINMALVGQKKTRISTAVLLIILIIIFIIELAGIGIKWLAPDSGAAQFIDNQLNNVIQLITGSTPDYEIPGIDYEV